MSIQHVVERDERTVVVENASYRWAFLFLAYALLLDVAYRGFVRNESSWDLLGFVVAGGLATVLYQWMHQVLSRSWVVNVLLTVCVAAVIGALMAFAGK
jgi:hypothetical protein